MDTQGLSVICADLGEQIEDDDGSLVGYSKSEYCLDNLKDLQRFLRRDHPQRRDVFKQICKWNTVARDLVPIIEYHQSDRNLVISAVKILVFLTMPIDPASDDVAQQIEYLWDLKAVVTRNVTIAVIVSLLEDPLEHLESKSFTEDDWKLVQLVLTLFRNILAIQGITLQQKASGSATQFLDLTDKFLELMFQENVMDIVLVLTQHVDDSRGYLHQDSLLLLEIFHHVLEGRDPELIAGASKMDSKVACDITTSVESLKSIMEEEEEIKRSIRQRNLERHSQFSGTFTCLAVDGSKTLFKGNPASAFVNDVLKVHKDPRGPLKKVAWDHGSMLLPKENILELLHNFLNQFLSGGYNVLMQSICDDILKEHKDIQMADIIIFFQVAQFVIAFQRKKVLLMQKQNMEVGSSEASLDGGSVHNISSLGDLCGPVAATLNETMFYLVISKWREASEGLKASNDHKPLSAAGSLMKNMIQMLDLVLKLLPEDSKESQTGRILLYKLFYDQTDEGLTQFLLNLFRSFDTHRQPKSDLADLLEIIHIVLRLMEKLQARGTLRVARKSRKGRKKKKNSGDVGSDRLMDEDGIPQNVGGHMNEAENPASEAISDINMTHSNFPDLSSTQKEGTPIANQVLDPDMPLKDALHHIENLFPKNPDKVNNPNDLTHETEGSSDGDQLPATSEVDFNVTRLVTGFANNTVIQNLCWLLKYHKSNPASTNHYIICMLRRFCDDLELSPMLYQLSVLTTFHGILSDKKLHKSESYANIIHFITKFVRKMTKILKSQPLLFVELLFWKTRSECHHINADALKSDLTQLGKDIRNLGNEGAAFSNFKGDTGYKSIADSLGDDEVDTVVTHTFATQGGELLSGTIDEDNIEKKGYSDKGKTNILTDDTDEDKSEGMSTDFPSWKTARRRKGSIFDTEQETAMRQLYEKYKGDRHCSRLIAESLDPDGKISSVQVSRKLKQLGLKLAPRKRLMSHMDTPDGEDAAGNDTSRTGATTSGSNEPDGSSYLNTSRRRKRVCSFNKEQELEVKILFERFKDKKKCSQLIASALGADNTYTAAQISHKLKQLGLVAPGKKSSLAPMHSGDDGTIEREDLSAEETLRAIKERSKRKKSQPSIQEAATTSISQQDTGDRILHAMFNESESVHGVGDETEASAALADHIDVKDDSKRDTPRHQDDETHDELMLEDSGDDLVAVLPRKIGSRRNLNMVIDDDDE